jgi:hypothetical protein
MAPAAHTRLMEHWLVVPHFTHCDNRVTLS